MKKTLRKKFILFAMLAVTILLVVLIVAAVVIYYIYGKENPTTGGSGLLEFSLEAPTKKPFSMISQAASRLYLRL